MKTLCTWIVLALTAVGTEAQSRAGDAPSRVIVKPRDAASFRKAIGTVLNTFIGVPVTAREIGATGVFEIETTAVNATTLYDAFDDLRDGFEYIETDTLFSRHGVALPEDPEFSHSRSQLWGLHAIRAPTAWLHGQGSKAIVAAVVDSGIDQNHEDLIDNLWRAKDAFRIDVDGRAIDCASGAYGFDAIDGDCEPQERQEHGTNVSGIIGARGDNEKGTVGVNWKVSLLPVAFLDATSAGSATHAARALEFIRSVKESRIADVRVLNLSWGAHHHSRLIEDQLIALAAQGVVIVTSAGNEAGDNDRWPVYPSSYDSVSTLISVAATRSDGDIARSSNFGKASVHIAAPGIGIRTTDPDNSYDSPFGTSMAAAVVTGAVALLASQCPDLTGMQLKQLILDTADRKKSLEPYVSDGRFLNLQAASKACAELRETGS